MMLMIINHVITLPKMLTLVPSRKAVNFSNSNTMSGRQWQEPLRKETELPQNYLT